MINRLLAVLITVTGLTLLAGCSSSDSSQSSSKVKKASATEVAPAVRAAPSMTARDIDGNVRIFSEWIGKQPVIINVWGTWCPPCRREIPAIIQLYKEYKPKGVEIVSMAVRDTPEKVRQFTQQAGMDWVMVMRDDHVLQRLGYSGSVPTTIFFNKEGYEVQRFVGARSYDDFKAAFEAITAPS